MRRPFFRIAAALLVAAVVFPGAALAQESSTGAVSGTVKTEDGQPIPGATVLIRTPQGTVEVVTNSQGEFIAPFLRPGNYTVEVRAEGYAPIIQPDVEVSLGQRTTLDYALASTLTEEVTVVGARPLVDRSSTSIGANIKVDQISANTPVGRNYTSLFFISPGVTTSGAGANAGSVLQGNPSVGGASGLENSYIIDGVNVTNTGYGGIGTFNIVYGSLGTGVTTDFLDEVQVKTGGFEAEYGQALGGILNAIVRSGTNEFGGQIGVYYTPGSLEGHRKLASLTPTTVNITEQEVLDIGLSVGGPIIKDKLFYFVAYNPVSTDTELQARFDPLAATSADVLTTAPVTRTRDNDNYAAKVTWLMTPKHRLEFTAFGDPSDGDEGAQRSSSLLTPQVTGPVRFTELEYGADNYSLKYEGVVTPRFFIEAQIGFHDGEFLESGIGTTIRNVNNLQVPGGLPTGGVGFYANQFDENMQYSLKFTNILGKHEIRYGVQFDDIEYTEDRLRSGPAYNSQIPVFDANGVWTQTYLPVSTSTGASVQRRTCDLVTDVDCEDFDLDGIGDVFRVVRSLYSPTAIETTTEETSYFIQDTWTVTPYFTIKAGLRHTIDEIEGGGNFTLPFTRAGFLAVPDSFTPTGYRFSGNTAPRLGFTWDVLQNGKSKLYANFGRYYQRIPNDLAVRALSNEVSISREEFKDPDLTDVREARTCNIGGGMTAFCSRPSIFGEPTRIEAGTKLPYQDEFIVGYAYELTPNSSIETRLIFREEGRVLEDVQFTTLESTQNYYYYVFEDPNDPFSAAFKSQFAYQAADGSPCEGAYVPFPTFSCEAFGEYVLANPGDNTPSNLPPAVRDYNAWEIIYNRRMQNKWQLYASYRYSRLNGNYEGLFRNDNGQSDPNITSLYDFPQSTLTQGQYIQGRLNLDTPHIFRAYGAYQLPNNITLGAALNVSSGVPRFPLLAHPSYQNAGEIPGIDPVFDNVDVDGDGIGDAPFGGILLSYTPVQRGFMGRTPMQSTIDLHVDWRPTLGGGTTLKLALDIFNVLNQQEQTGFNDNVELTTQLLDPNFLRPLFFQAPRQVRFSAVWQF